MNDNPYAPPKTVTNAIPTNGSAEELRTIATCQRAILISLLIQIVSLLMLIPLIPLLVIQLLTPQSGSSDTLVIVLIWSLVGLGSVCWLAGLIGAFQAARLALQLHQTAVAVLFGVLVFFPVFCMIGLFVISLSATARLHEFEVPVGLLGADAKALEDRIAQLWPVDSRQPSAA